MSLIYSLFGMLDYAIYSIASVLIRVIIELSKENIFGANQINSIVNKVYIVVGVLMLFKLVISAIQFMVNPDTFDDKEKGLGGILKKTVISLALIVLVPAVFDFAMEMQGPIIETLPKIILTDSNRLSTNSTDKKEDPGNEIAFTVLESFVSPKKDNANKISDLNTFHDNIADGCGFFDNGSGCNYNYMIIISTLCGGFLVYVLLSLGLDVAIRAIKFSIIRILAPIPISSYIYSKDKLNKFFKTASQVYLDLFIRMAIIYFIIFAIDILFQSDFFKGSPDRDFFMNLVVKTVLIFGLLMFAKQAPKFISELLGLPDIGSGDMADMFKPAWQRAGGAAVPIGMAKAAAGNAINRAKFMQWGKDVSVGQKLKNVAKVAGSATAGAASAGFHGGIAAMQGKNVKDVKNAGYKRAIKARQNRDLDELNGIKWYDRVKTKAINELGIDTKASLADNKQKAYSTLHSDVGSFKKSIMGRIDKNPTVAMRSDGAAMSQLGQILYESKDIIQNGTNEDLKNVLKKFDVVDVKDSNGRVIGQTYKLNAKERLGYYDLEAIRVNAEQSNIGSISGKMEPLKTIAQKELFSDAMSGKVVDISGKLMDEFNYGNEGYVAAGYTRGADGVWRDASGQARRQAHSDVTTAVQSAMQHITENRVPLGIDQVLLQKWFQGTATQQDIDELAPNLPPEVQKQILNKDFGALDDYYQRKSEELSSEMASSKEHLARASIERRNANKDNK